MAKNTHPAVSMRVPGVQHISVWLAIFLTIVGMTSCGGTRSEGPVRSNRGSFAARANESSADSGTTPNSQRKVHALGRLEPRGTVLSISAPSGNEGATVKSLHVAEGDDVVAGQVLAVLDSVERREAAVQEARARLGAEEARLEQVRAGAKSGDIAAQASTVQRMEFEAQAALKELERARELARQNILSAENLELKQLAYDRALLERSRAADLLESLKEVREVDVHLQEMQVATAQASLARALAELDATQVKASITGRILRLHARPGERIGEQGILEMGDVEHMQAVAEVFEGDVLHLREGLRADVRLDSSGETMQGTIEQLGLIVARKDVLSNDPISDTDARVLEVRVLLNPEDARKVERLSNARVEVTIALEQPSKTPNLPQATLTHNQQNSSQSGGSGDSQFQRNGVAE